jgi:hypothetical protein
MFEFEYGEDTVLNQDLFWFFSYKCYFYLKF